MRGQQADRWVRTDPLILNWVGGKLLAFVRADAEGIDIEPADIELLDRLTAPLTLESVLDCCAPADKSARAARLAMLCEWKLIVRFADVDSSETESAKCAEPQSPQSYELYQQRLQRGLQAIITSAREVAADCSAFGPLVPHLEEHSPLNVMGRVESVRTSLADLLGELKALRQEFVSFQIGHLDLCVGTELRLNLGSGGRGIAGWVNLDLFPAQVCLNLNWGLPFPDSSVSYIYCCLTLEHLFYMRQAASLLADCHRVLRDGGVLRVVVPDMERLLKEYALGNSEFFRSQGERWSWVNEVETPLEIVLAWSGLHFEQEHLFGHRMGYDYSTLRRLLQRSGFCSVERSDYMASIHEELRVDDFSSDGGWCHEGRPLNLFVDAVRVGEGIPVTPAAF